MTPQIENIKHPLLREFAENAQHTSKGDFGMTIYGGVNLTAYAELIVKECLTVIGKERRARLDKADLVEANDIQKSAIAIIKHFEFKEN